MRKSVKSKHTNKLEGYNHLLKDVQSILQNGLGRVYKAVDNIKVQTYWQVGERIVREELRYKERADYGEKVIVELSLDLKISKRLLFEIIRFYKIYQIVHTLCAQLSWSHYRLLIKIRKKEERTFYEIQAINNKWSKRELEKRIKNKEYEKIKKEGEIVTKLPLQTPAPEDVFKDTYHWDFLDLEENHSEKQLEDALLKSIRQILLEFGHGFGFMGNQQKILIADQWHKVDLVFYHRFLKCIVLVELKTEKFRSEFVGQTNKYLTYFRENKLEYERDPIGLIICKEKSREEVHYAIGKLKEDIFVAEYKTYLPSEEEIRKKIKKMK
jgi:predicted nuclease of restriction endonuclease-like (RecB) superfamily